MTKSDVQAARNASRRRNENVLLGAGFVRVGKMGSKLLPKCGTDKGRPGQIRGQIRDVHKIIKIAEPGVCGWRETGGGALPQGPWPSPLSEAVCFQTIIKTIFMETKKFLYYQEDDMFIGWLDDYPHYKTHGQPLMN